MDTHTRTSLFSFDPVGGEIARTDKARIKRFVRRSKRVYMESVLFKNELVKVTKKEVYRLLSQDDWDNLSNGLTFYFWTLPAEGKSTLFICRK